MLNSDQKGTVEVITHPSQSRARRWVALEADRGEGYEPIGPIGPPFLETEHERYMKVRAEQSPLYCIPPPIQVRASAHPAQYRFS